MRSSLCRVGIHCDHLVDRECRLKASGHGEYLPSEEEHARGHGREATWIYFEKTMEEEWIDTVRCCHCGRTKQRQTSNAVCGD